MANRFVFPNQQWFDANGNPGSGWQLEFLKPGTSTKKDTYTTEDLSTPNTNPVVADANGVWPDIWMDGTYDVRLLDANDAQKESWNSVEGPIFTGIGGGADQIPSNAFVGAFVPEILLSATDTYTADFGRTIGEDETTQGSVQTANTGAPTLNGDTITTKDGSALWAGALEGVHRFQRASSSWLVLDPNPSSQVDPIAYADQSEADAESAAETYTDGEIAAITPQIASAWVNFDGTGTVSIRDSHNVSSITDEGVGDYTVNLANAMADGNYAAVVTGTMYAAASNTYAIGIVSAPTATSVRMLAQVSNGDDVDMDWVTTVIFGDLA